MNSPVIDTAIGLVFVFLIYSLLATSINEAISTLFALRARMLKKGIVTGMLSDSKHKEWIWIETVKSITATFRKLLYLVIGYKPEEKATLGSAIYNHPIIKNYGANMRYQLPSYISAENFTKVLIDVLNNYYQEHKEQLASFVTSHYGKTIDPDAAPSITRIYYLVKYLLKYPGQNNQVSEGETETASFTIDKETLQILDLHLEKSYQNLDLFTKQIESWYDDSMNRITGWYKRQVQFILFFIGISIAILFNVNVIDIAGKLSTDKDARDKLVQMAIKSSEELKNNPRVKQHATITAELQKGEIDSTKYKDSKKEYDSIITKYNTEVKEINDNLKSRIKDANNLLAVGWGDYGRKDDSLAYIKRYRKCFECYRNLIRKDATVKLQKAKKILTKQKADTTAAGKEKYAISGQQFKKDSIESRDTAKINQKAFIKLYQSKQYRIKARYVITHFYQGRKLIGYLILAFGVCLGAPFWFDLLQKLIKIRSAGKKEEAKEDNKNDTAGTGSTNTNGTSITINTTTEAVG